MTGDPTDLRLDATKKAEAYAIFEQIGLKPDQAFNLFLSQVVLHQGLPFSVKVPNKETQAAMDELKNGGGTHYSNVDEIFKNLDDDT